MAEGIQIVPATVQDNKRVDKFMKDVFVRDEPLCVCLKLAKEEEPEDDDDDMEVLSQGLSLLALDENGDMLGMALSGKMTPQDADFLEKKAMEGQEKGFLKIMRFLANMDKKSRVWEELGVSKGLGVFILAIAPQARGQGLGRRLLQRSCEVGKENQLPMVRVDCTSCYSANICEKMGMECIFSLPYNEYVDQEGNPVFSPPAPHSVFKMFVQKL